MVVTKSFELNNNFVQMNWNIGLIDGIGNYKDAIDVAKELGGITGEPYIIKREASYSFMDLLLGFFINSKIGNIFQQDIFRKII